MKICQVSRLMRSCTSSMEGNMGGRWQPTALAGQLVCCSGAFARDSQRPSLLIHIAVVAMAMLPPQQAVSHASS